LPLRQIQASDRRAHRAVLQAAHTHGPPTYTLPRLPASSSSPTVPTEYIRSRSMVTGGAGSSVTDVPLPDDGSGGGAAENDSSAKDSPSGTVPGGVRAEVNHLGGNATRGGVSRLGVPRTRRGGTWGRVAKGGRRRGTCRCAISEWMVVLPWAKRLGWRVMRDIIATVRLWGIEIS